MDPVSRDLSELRHPRADVLALRVAASRLLRNMEPIDTAAREAGRTDPFHPIGANVIVRQHRLEVVRATTPLHPQVQRHVAGHTLPPFAGHPPRRFQFPHVGVDQGHPPLPLTPPPPGLTVRIPQLRLPDDPAGEEDPVPALAPVKAVEIVPQQLVHDPIRGLVGRARPFVRGDLVVHLPGGYAPQRHPRR